jgi:hypothetical protein
MEPTSGKLADVDTGSTPTESTSHAGWRETFFGVVFLVLALVLGSAVLLGTIFIIGRVATWGDPECPPQVECPVDD